MKWARLLAPLAVIAPSYVVALPTQSDDSATAISPAPFNNGRQCIVPEDVLPGAIWSAIPLDERPSPGFNFTERLDQLIEANPDMGWTHVLKGNPWNAEPWPRGHDEGRKNLVVIEYCWIDEAAKNKAEGTFLAAVKIWEDALGAPSRDNKHGLTFKDVKEYCMVGDKKNPNVWHDILRLSISDIPDGFEVGTSMTTLGYRATEPHHAWPNRMYIGHFDPDPNKWASVLTHEIGHVFGFHHEHQRSNRDRHVRFQCEKLPGYEQAKQKAIEKKLNVAHLCDDMDVVLAAEFEQIYNYWKGDILGREVTEGRSFDVDSIMMYDSFIQPECNDIEKCALTKYIDPANHKKGVERIPVKHKPTAMDVEELKKLYPWKD